jgi:DNA-binding response OmpR family regulator
VPRTTFRDCHCPMPAVALEPSRTDVAEPADPKILIVEDKAALAMLLEDMLSDLGYRTPYWVSNPDDALNTIASIRIDCALLDVNLGRESVFPVAEKLKRQGVPFAFATGYGRTGVPPAWSGIPVLQKPFVFTALQRVLHDLLGRNAKH